MDKSPKQTQAMSLENTNSLRLNGIENRVSRVPISFSPVVISIAKLTIDSRAEMVKIMGIISPRDLPDCSTWLATSSDSILMGSNTVEDTLCSVK